MGYDQEKAQEYALRVWKLKEGEVVTRMMRIGDQLGLYRALAEMRELTPAELATATTTDPRFITEWLYGQAAAGLVDHADGVFSLSAEAASVLANDESLLFAGGAFSPEMTPDHFDLVLAAVRSGSGFTYGDMGEEVAADLDRSGGAWLRTYLPMAVIPQLGGVVDRLMAGGRILEIGCGGGVALRAMAAAYPASNFVGIDPSPAGTSRAVALLADLDNVEIRTQLAEDLAPDEGPFDLVMALDCMHDMPRPDLVAGRVRDIIADGGVWLVKDIRCGPSFDDNRRNPLLALMYGFSVSTCLPSSMSTDDGLGLGTLGLHPERLTEIVNAAGFSDLRTLETDDPVHLYYEITV